MSEGDRPPKDTSEEEIEEWNASAVIIPSVDPGYEIAVMEHTFECGSQFQLPGQGVQGLRLRGAFSGIPILRNFDVTVIMKCSKPIVGSSKPIVHVRN